MQRYEHYKNSGIEWLGEIPEHWEVKPFCAIFKIKSVTNHINYELLSVYLDRGVIKFNEAIEKRTNVTSTDLSKYQLVEVGDFVLNNQQAWRGSVGVSSHKGIISPAYIVLCSDNILNKNYANYLFRDRSMVVNYLISSKGVGTIQRNLYWAELKRKMTILPPLAEQTAIANFLDTKCEQIDRAVAQKERVIELLNERRQTVIQRAVTRGLNPNVPLRDSGIDWIGEIPAHWDFCKIKNKFLTCSGGTPTSGRIEYYNGNIPWIRTTDLTNNKLESYEVSITEKALNESSAKLVPKDSILVAMYGGAGTIGKCGILTFRSAINQALCAILPSSSAIPMFIFYYILFYRPFWMIGADGTRKDPNISQDVIKNVFIPLPPLAEQTAIAEYLDNVNEKIDRAVALKREEVEKLKEYKQTLINSAVTGKIKIA